MSLKSKIAQTEELLVAYRSVLDRHNSGEKVLPKSAYEQVLEDIKLLEAELDAFEVEAHSKLWLFKK